MNLETKLNIILYSIIYGVILSFFFILYYLTYTFFYDIYLVSKILKFCIHFMMFLFFTIIEMGLHETLKYPKKYKKVLKEIRMMPTFFMVIILSSTFNYITSNINVMILDDNHQIVQAIVNVETKEGVDLEFYEFTYESKVYRKEMNKLVTYNNQDTISVIVSNYTPYISAPLSTFNSDN